MQSQVKINVDESFRNSYMGVGGVLHDHARIWVEGFVNSIPNGDYVKVELLAIKEGLSATWNYGFWDVVCETDDREACNDILCHETNRGRVHLRVGVVNNICALLRRN